MHPGPPVFWQILIIGGIFGVFLMLGCFSPIRGSFFFKALFLILLGFLVTEGHRYLKNTPRKAWRVLRPIFNASVTGTVQEIAFQTSRPTVILGPPAFTVSFETKQGIKQGQKRHFKNLRQSLRVILKKDDPLPAIGDLVSSRFFLMPIQSKLTPYGFDFERYAYFKGLGGSGYALEPFRLIKPAPQNTTIENLRRSVGRRIHRYLQGHEAAVAAALFIGDRSAIPRGLRDTFVDAGIAHVLAISGLHLTLVTGLFFFILRRLFCLIPAFALSHDTKKGAAGFALLGGFFYLLLSGASISTQRAFIMMAFMMGALWLDRGAFSKRTVMVAAFIILLVQPIALFMPSFHLSFFAVIALISVYAYWRQTHVSFFGGNSLWRRFFVYIQGLLLASFTASLATIPFTIYHFHKFTLQSVVANLLVIPLMSFWIMPLALLAFLLMPFGLEGGVLKAMGQGISHMILVGQKVATWPGAVIQVPELPGLSLALMLIGSFFIYIFQGWHKGIGFLLIALSFCPVLWQNPPTVFINEGANTVGIREKYTLWVTNKKIPTFATRVWSESLGIPLENLRPWAKKDDDFMTFKTPCGVVGYAKTQEEGQKLCPLVNLLISRRLVACPSALIVTARDTWRQGAYFIYCKENHWTIKSVKPFPYRWPWE